MDLASAARPWAGRVYRHIPAQSPFGPLDTRFAARSREHRWNAAGEPTLYFGGDRGVLITEFGRHFRESRQVDPGSVIPPRQIYAADVSLQRVLDLRDARVLAQLGGLDPPTPFFDRTITGALAAYTRHLLRIEALMVPSMAFLDDAQRWNLVLFLDRLGAPLDEIVTQVTKAGAFVQTDALENAT